MSKLRAVIRREYLTRVKSRWFLLTTLLAPILLVGAMLLPVLLLTGPAQTSLNVAIVDESGLLKDEILHTEPFESGRLRHRPPPDLGERPSPSELRERVLREEISGYLHIPADVLEAGRVEYWGRDISGMAVRSSLAEAATTAVRRVRARRLGLDPEAIERLTGDTRLETYRITEEGAERGEEAASIVAHLLAIAIYMVVLIYGAMMLRAAVAEKSNKTVEIILSSIRPWQLMLGKTLGVGAVGLTQVGIWLLILAVFLLYAGTAALFADVELLQNLPVGVDTLLVFLGLFLTGYFLYGGMYASAGALASNEQEASQLQIPVTLVAIIPIIILPVVIESPTRDASVILSFVPFFTPVLFMARYVLGVVAPWELPLVFALQVAAIGLVAWIGGRIYRIGLLMTGKRPTLPELLRWIRHG